MKVIRENNLVVNEDSKGTQFEKNTAAWLNDHFGKNGWEFSQFGGSDATVLDVGGFKDTDEPIPENVRAWIECKYANAQAGQFTLSLGDDDTFVFSERDDKPAFSKLASIITKLLNSNGLKYSQVTTKGHNINDNELEINIDDFPSDSIKNLLFNLIKADYYDRKCEVMAFGKNLTEPKFTWIKDLENSFDIKGVVRIKNNNKAISFPKDYDFGDIVKAAGADNYYQAVGGSKDGRLFVSYNDKPSFSNFNFDGNEYALSLRNIPDDIKKHLGGFVREVRSNGDSGKPVVICTLYPKKGFDGMTYDELENYLKSKIGVNEGLDMRQNLSEELIINDDISLGSLDHDDEECKKELAKEIEKNEKEVSDELTDRVEEVEEINTAEAPKVEIHDAEDKKIKIKGLTERLILEEPEDTLNEDFGSWTEDTYMDKYFTAVHDVYAVLYKFIRDCGDYMHEAGENQLDTAESICDEAVVHFEEALDEFGNLTEEVLDEKIPGDLSKAYKKYNYKGRSGVNTDLENATYTVIDDPAEAYKLYKQDPKSIRLLFGNDLIDFRDDGRPSDIHRDTWLGNGKEFVNRNGKVVRDSMYVPPKELIKRADKIYVTNEHTPEGQKDQAKLAARRENPESPNSNVGNRLRNYSHGKRHYWNNDERRGDASRSDSYDLRSLNNYKDTLQTYERRLAQADQTGDYGWRGRDRMVQDIEDARNSVASMQGRIKDNKARRRYADSEIALQRPLERFIELKGSVDQLQDRVNDSAQDLETARKEGSPSSRRNKERLRELQQDMLELRKKIAAVELDLEETDEEDAKAVEAAERKYLMASMEYDTARAEIDQLLRRNK